MEIENLLECEWSVNGDVFAPKIDIEHLLEMILTSRKLERLLRALHIVIRNYCDIVRFTHFERLLHYCEIYTF